MGQSTYQSQVGARKCTDIHQVEETPEEKEARIRRLDPVPNNNILNRRTRQVFKRRREKRKEAKKYQVRVPVQPAGLYLPNPNLRFVGLSTQPTSTTYRPPTYLSHWGPDSGQSGASILTLASPIASAATASLRRRKIATFVEAPSQNANAHWPPPQDTNQVKAAETLRRLSETTSDSPSLVPEYHDPQPKLKFVDCDKCGKKNLSSKSQLRDHQQSKRCRNLRISRKNRTCLVCEAEFDNLQNLRTHICRK